MIKCPFKDCNMVEGHEGPHGFAVNKNIVLAPFGGGEGKIAGPTLVDLRCDICGSQMKMFKFENGGGRFECTRTAEPDCEQEWYFYPNGRINHTILAKMYPSNMNKESKIYDEFLSHQLKEHGFKMRASVLCGILTQARAEEEMLRAHEDVDAVRKEIRERKASRKIRASLNFQIFLWAMAATIAVGLLVWLFS